MSSLTTVSTKGQVTIPEEVRQILRVKIGDKVSFTKISPTIREVVIKIIPSNIVNELSGSLTAKIRVSNHEKVRRTVKKLLARKYKIE